MEQQPEHPDRPDHSNSTSKDASNIELLDLHPKEGFHPLNQVTARKRWHVMLWSEIGEWFMDWWMGELLAILISIVAFIAIIIVLDNYDGRTLPRLPRNVSLNFVVSTLATVSKGSLLLAVASAIGQYNWLWVSSRHRPLQDLQAYDEASRGLLGSSKLLMSGKVLFWAALGTLVTIICFVFEPFVQGLIQVSERMVYHDSPDLVLKSANDYPYIGYRYTLDYPVINVITDAAFHRGVLAEIQPPCPTGNCSWPTFTSLGFCYDCEDFTQAMQNSSAYKDEVLSEATPADILRTYTYQLPDWNGHALLTIPTATHNNSYLVDDSSWNRSFSFQSKFYSYYGAVDQYHNLDDMSFEVGNVPEFLILPVASNSTLILNMTDGTSLPQPAAMMAFIRPSTRTNDTGRILQADVCALRLCAQKRNVSVSSNQLLSTITETVYGKYNHEVSPSGDTYPDVQWWTFEGTDINMTYPSNWNGIDSQTWLPMSTVEINNATYAFFYGNITTTMIPPLDKTIAASVGLIRDQASSNIMYAFNASTNISATIHNIATGMTNYIRDTSNVTISGKAGVSERYIHIVWPWITLPAFLVAAGTVFLVITMFETKVRGLRVWKTAELAVLLHPITESGQEVESISEVSEMTSEASGMMVKLVRVNSNKWTLRR